MPDSNEHKTYSAEIMDKEYGEGAHNVREAAREDLTLSLNLKFKEKRDKDNFFRNISRLYRIGWVINDMPTEHQLDLIEFNPYLIKLINNPNEQFINKAIERNYKAIWSVDNPTDEMEAIALSQNTDAGRFICHHVLDLSNPHKYGPKAKQVWDVWDHWYNIFSIENPCKEAKELAERIKEVGKKDAEIFRCDPYPLH